MLDKYLPKERVRRKNESELFVEFDNDSILPIVGADDPDSIRGRDLDGVGIDEWALIKREIWEEIVRPIITQNSSRWAVFAFTPKGINHAHEYWMNAIQWKEWYRSFLPASASGLLSQEELEKARIEMSNALYNQEMECSFVAREEKSFITGEMLEALKNIQLFNPYEHKYLIACDPAFTFDGDDCVIKAFEDTYVVETKVIHEDNTMNIVGELMLMGSKYKTDNYAIDEIQAKGICDRLQELGKKVIRIDSRKKATNEEDFYNRRAEMWWYVAEKIRQKQLRPVDDLETIRQLVAVKYETLDSRGRIKAELKKYTKELLGKSPDHADCYDGQTEILTKKGWKFFDELDYKDKVISLDPKTGKTQYRPIDYIHIRDYKGKMYLYEGDTANFCISPEHRLLLRYYIKPKNSPKKIKSSNWHFRPINQIGRGIQFCMKRNFIWKGRIAKDIEFRCKKNGKGQFEAKQYKFAINDWLEFLGWYLSEGMTYQKRKNNTYWISIWQSKEKNPEKWEEIKQLLSRMHISYSLIKKRGFVFGSRAIGKHLIKHCKKGAINKCVPNYVKFLLPQQMRIFLDAYFKGDGTYANKVKVYGTSSRQLANDIQELILKTGSYASVSIRDNIGRSRWIKDHWGTTRHLHYLINEYSNVCDINIVAKKIKQVDYDGKIYCITTNPYHTIYVRRNGKGMWSGNCYVYGIWGLQYITPEGALPEKSYSYKKTLLQSAR